MGDICPSCTECLQELAPAGQLGPPNCEHARAHAKERLLRSLRMLVDGCAANRTCLISEEAQVVLHIRRVQGERQPRCWHSTSVAGLRGINGMFHGIDVQTATHHVSKLPVHHRF